jgi:hypothetical protein
MRVNSSRPGMSILGQRPDDLVDVAARAEIAAGAGDHHRLHLAGISERPERVAKLGIAFEGQRVLPLRPVERDRRHAVGEIPAEVGGLEGLGVHAISTASTVSFGAGSGQAPPPPLPPARSAGRRG